MSIRYPKSVTDFNEKHNFNDIKIGTWEYVTKSSSKICILTFGRMIKHASLSAKAIKIESNVELTIVNSRFIKPLDKTYHIFKRDGKNYLKSTYWFEMKSDFIGKFKPQKKEGITRVEWIGIENLSSILPKSYANIRLLIG